MSADIADRAYRVAVELESRATTWESIGRPDLGAKDRHHAAMCMRWRDSTTSG